MKLESTYGRLLFEVEAVSIKELLVGAVEQRANLSGADLFEANLSEANLSGADLSGANLSEANLSAAKIDGYEISKWVQLVGVAEWGSMFCFLTPKNKLRIKIGCRHFSLSEAREHWKDRTDRAGTRLALQMAIYWAMEVRSKSNG